MLIELASVTRERLSHMIYDLFAWDDEERLFMEKMIKDEKGMIDALEKQLAAGIAGEAGEAKKANLEFTLSEVEHIINITNLFILGEKGGHCVLSEEEKGMVGEVFDASYALAEGIKDTSISQWFLENIIQGDEDMQKRLKSRRMAMESEAA